MYRIGLLLLFLFIDKSSNSQVLIDDYFKSIFLDNGCDNFLIKSSEWFPNERMSRVRSFYYVNDSLHNKLENSSHFVKNYIDTYINKSGIIKTRKDTIYGISTQVSHFEKYDVETNRLLYSINKRFMMDHGTDKDSILYYYDLYGRKASTITYSSSYVGDCKMDSYTMIIHEDFFYTENNVSSVFILEYDLCGHLYNSYYQSIQYNFEGLPKKINLYTNDISHHKLFLRREICFRYLSSKKFSKKFFSF